MKTAGGWARGLLVLSLAAATTACSGERSRTIELTVRDSRFTPSSLSVRAGERVRFVIRNADPIPHEFILGTHAEQLAHERGTDATHDGAPGAASLDIGETATVAYLFERAGELEFACHLPGHYAYGMRGTVEVS